MTKRTNNGIACIFAILLLFQSCAIYQGNYSLGHAVANEKKVKVKFRYEEYLLYKGYRYGYDKTDNHDFWTLLKPQEWSKKPHDSIEFSKSPFPDIYRKNGTYYGVTDVSDHNTWVQIAFNDIKVITKTDKQTYKKILYQEGHYFGIPKDDFDTDLVLIYEDEVEKVSYYDPALSVLGSILITPVVVALILFTPVEDDW